MPLQLVAATPVFEPGELRTDPLSGRPLPELGRAQLVELFAGDGRDGAATGFVLAALTSGASVLWVQDRMALREGGRVHPRGLPPCELIHVEAPDAKAALWAMEEGLRCPALGLVVGEIWGEPRALDFTATRRLAVAAEAGGVPATLILFAAEPNLSGARMRWRVASRPSPPHLWDVHAPGASAWTLELFKARGASPGRWEVAREADGVRLLPPLGDGKLDAADRRHAA